MDGREELWKKIIDTHRMSPPGHSPMGLLKWRRVFSISTGATVTAVGLLPIAVSGIDIERLMAGAMAEREDCLRNPSESASAQYAALRNNLYQDGKKIAVMPVTTGSSE